jgi:hypothetical protein
VASTATVTGKALRTALGVKVMRATVAGRQACAGRSWRVLGALAGPRNEAESPKPQDADHQCDCHRAGNAEPGEMPPGSDRNPDQGADRNSDRGDHKPGVQLALLYPTDLSRLFRGERTKSGRANTPNISSVPSSLRVCRLPPRLKSWPSGPIGLTRLRPDQMSQQRREYPTGSIPTMLIPDCWTARLTPPPTARLVRLT